MKTSYLWAAALMLATGNFTVNAQTNIATSTLTSRGLEAGTSGTGNAFFGYRAGKVNTATGLDNTFIGNQSGWQNTSGKYNTFLGYESGHGNATGNSNVFIGMQSGHDNIIGNSNVFVGNSSGITNNGNYNVYLGSNAGADSSGGSNNVYIGDSAGNENSGSNNIFIGKDVGSGTTQSNKLNIDNANSSTPLIWGDFAADLLKFNGKVGISLGTAAFPATGGSIDVSAYKLIVNGGILAKEVRVATTWADYVFKDTYNLPTLPEVEKYIIENGHLPNVPSAKQVEADGIEIGQMAKIQQEKIEELTLYAIQQQKQLDKQQKEIEELKALVLKLAGSK